MNCAGCRKEIDGVAYTGRWGDKKQTICQECRRILTVLGLIKTHCPKNHEYTEENTRTTKEGWKTCRKCHAEKELDRQAKKRQEKEEKERQEEKS